MPPVGFFQAANSKYASGSLTFLTPSDTESGDVLYAFIVQPGSGGTFALAPGWTLVDQINEASGFASVIYVCRHVAPDTEPASHVFQISSSSLPPLGLLLLYRGFDSAASLVDAQVNAFSGSSTSFVAPSATTTTYSDLGVLLYYANDVAGTTTFTMPSGTTQRAIVEGISGDGGAGGGSLAAADYATAAGATGTKTATASVAGIGIAANFAIKAVPTVGAPYVIPDVPGAIGLPTVGV